ncbi:glycogen/starch synthase [Flavobacterium sp.]|uniref:glycogen/starch synthase n=1 Tax=Flavobacterium sp. TaxID=239 RepID=UPI00286E27A3|nr:glycogen/starch synthase [Flavobacterium sp.]
MKKISIAFIELETHSALLEQWYFLLKEMNGIDFHFFVHQKVKEKLTGIPEIAITLVLNASEIDPQIDDFDAVIVNTFHRNFEQYQYIFRNKPTLILIHNINFSLFFKKLNLKNIWLEKERFVYYLKLYFLEKISSNRKFIQNASNYGVLSPNLLETIASKNSNLSLNTQVVSLNYCKKSSFKTSKSIHIVMPGNVSRKRKDIDLVFDVIAGLNPKSKLQFTFLGKPESNEILNRIEKLKVTCHQNITIQYYSKFIPWEEYSDVISKSHLLLCPIKSKTSFYWVDEVYGKTKVSGAETDCIYNGKVGLFPQTYPKMHWHNLYYENSVDLSFILNELTLENLEMEYQKLDRYLDDYSFEKVKNKLENQLLELAKAQ